jgi:hypothetical protein
MTNSGSPSITVIDGRSPTEIDGDQGNRDSCFPPKQNNAFRIGFNNINGFPTRKGSTKQKEMTQFLGSGQFDLFGMAETNTHWRNAHAHLKDITYGWFQKININTSYFQSYATSSSFQVGGVSQWAINELASRVSTHGEDKAGAGRWVWQDILGTKGSKTRILTAYCPVKNESSLGSTWNQQTTLGELFTNPIERFINDLTTEIEHGLEQGFHILLMIDANQDVRSGLSNSARVLTFGCYL